MARLLRAPRHPTAGWGAVHPRVSKDVFLHLSDCGQHTPRVGDIVKFTVERWEIDPRWERGPQAWIFHMGFIGKTTRQSSIFCWVTHGWEWPRSPHFDEVPIFSGPGGHPTRNNFKPSCLVTPKIQFSVGCWCFFPGEVVTSHGILQVQF